MSELIFPNLRGCVMVPKWRWVDREMQKENAAPLEAVFIGSSLAWCDVNMNELASQVGSRSILNLAVNWSDRHLDYLFLRKLMERRKVKNVLLDALPYTFGGHHRLLPYVLSWADLKEELTFTARKTGEEYPFRNFSSFKNFTSLSLSYLGTMVSRPALRLAATLFQAGLCTDEECWKNDETLGFLVTDTTLKPDTPKLLRGEDPQGTPIQNPVQWKNTDRNHHYLQKIAALATQHGAKVWFVAYPWRSSLNVSPELRTYYDSQGTLLVPDVADLKDRSYWFDPEHLFKKGSVIFTQRLARLLLEKGAFSERPRRDVTSETDS